MPVPPTPPAGAAGVDAVTGNDFAARRSGVTPSNFLGQISAADYASLVRIARIRHYAKGEFVFSAGSPGETVYFLRSGQIKIGQLSPLGREVILWFFADDSRHVLRHLGHRLHRPRRHSRAVARRRFVPRLHGGRQAG